MLHRMSRVEQSALQHAQQVIAVETDLVGLDRGAQQQAGQLADLWVGAVGLDRGQHADVGMSRTGHAHTSGNLLVISPMRPRA
jgi:hypothetical protein